MWDLNSLVAIDIHTHAHTPPEMADPEELRPSARRCGPISAQKGDELTMPEIAAYYRERKIGCVIFTVDSEARTGHQPLSERGGRQGRRREQRHHDPVRQH